MKYIMRYTDEIKIGDYWHTLGFGPDESLTEDNIPKVEEYEARTFEELQKWAKGIYGMTNETVPFFNIPYVTVFSGFTSWHIFKNDFKRHGTYEFRRVWKPFNPTMKWLVENLSADDFAEYAKDRGWNNIVVAR